MPEPKNQVELEQAHVTEDVRKQYESLRVTDDEARVIIANTTTRIVLKGDSVGLAPGCAKD